MRRWLVAGSLLGLPACVGPGAQAPGATPDGASRNIPEREASTEARVERLERVPVPAPRPAVTGEVPQPILDKLRVDAATRLGVAPAALEVRRAESVTWNDGSLGCPQPGVIYTQALQPGYWVVLGSGDATVDYRVRSNGLFRVCGPAKEKGLPREGEAR